MARPYRRTPWRRALNAVVRPLARHGLAGRRLHLLTVPGRRTGRPWSTPVAIVDADGGRWLVAPVAGRSWVLNARAAGWPSRRTSRGVVDCAGGGAVRTGPLQEQLLQRGAAFHQVLPYARDVRPRAASTTGRSPPAVRANS